MKPRRLPPKVPEPNDLVVGWMTEVESTTKCKHGSADCATCGTTTKRDALHTTVGGRGVLGRAIDRHRRR